MTPPVAAISAAAKQACAPFAAKIYAAQQDGAACDGQERASGTDISLSPAAHARSTKQEIM